MKTSGLDIYHIQVDNSRYKRVNLGYPTGQMGFRYWLNVFEWMKPSDAATAWPYWGKIVRFNLGPENLIEESHQKCLHSNFPSLSSFSKTIFWQCNQQTSTVLSVTNSILYVLVINILYWFWRTGSRCSLLEDIYETTASVLLLGWGFIQSISSKVCPACIKWSRKFLISLYEMTTISIVSLISFTTN